VVYIKVNKFSIHIIICHSGHYFDFFFTRYILVMLLFLCKISIIEERFIGRGAHKVVEMQAPSHPRIRIRITCLTCFVLRINLSIILKFFLIHYTNTFQYYIILFFVKKNHSIILFILASHNTNK